MSDEIKCPKCGSTQVHADKRGFKTGNAVAGALAGGLAVGAVTGAAGSNKIKITCLKCGYSYYAGDYEKEVRKIAAKSVPAPKVSGGVAAAVWGIIAVFMLIIWIVADGGFFAAALCVFSALAFFVCLIGGSSDDDKKRDKQAQAEYNAQAQANYANTHGNDAIPVGIDKVEQYIKALTLSDEVIVQYEDAKNNERPYVKIKRSELNKIKTEYDKCSDKINTEKAINTSAADNTNQTYIDIDAFIEKYLGVIPSDLFGDLNKLTLQGHKYVYLTASTIRELDELLATKKVEKKELSDCVELNNEGIEYEKSGDIDKAILTYEKNIKSNYPAHHSHKRLMVLYRKRKDYYNECRVIKRALEVFPDEPEYVERLEKATNLLVNAK